MKNDQSPPCDDLQKTNLVYEFTCPEDGCEHLRNSYIGVTQTSLSRRLTMHKASGAPKMHLNGSHNKPLTRETLVQNTKILRQENDPHRLLVMEALMIQQKNPSLNQQATGYQRTLKLHGSRSERASSQPSTQEPPRSTQTTPPR